MSIFVYTFENLDGNRTTVKTSHELKPVFLEALMDSFGNSFELEIEGVEPVVSDTKAMAKRYFGAGFSIGYGGADIC